MRKLECECTGSGTCKETYIDGSYHPSIFTFPVNCVCSVRKLQGVNLFIHISMWFGNEFVINNLFLHA